jgi:hypothetical protein
METSMMAKINNNNLSKSSVNIKTKIYYLIETKNKTNQQQKNETRSDEKITYEKQKLGKFFQIWKINFLLLFYFELLIYKLRLC